MSGTKPAEADRQGVLKTLERHGVRYVVIGGAAAEARGWRGRSLDIDVVPATDESNLDRLAVALNELDARLAVGAGEPDGVTVPGGFDARLLATNTVWNLLTSHGPLDLTFKPSGTDGYEDLARRQPASRCPGATCRYPSLPARTSSGARRPLDARRISQCCPSFVKTSRPAQGRDSVKLSRECDYEGFATLPSRRPRK